MSTQNHTELVIAICYDSSGDDRLPTQTTLHVFLKSFSGRRKSGKSFSSPPPLPPTTFIPEICVSGALLWKLLHQILMTVGGIERGKEERTGEEFYGKECEEKGWKGGDGHFNGCQSVLINVAPSVRRNGKFFCPEGKYNLKRLCFRQERERVGS